MALLATIPAFYIELLEQLPTPLATAIYLTAAGILALALWRVATHLDHPRQHLRRNVLDLALIAGFVLLRRRNLERQSRQSAGAPPTRTAG